MKKIGILTGGGDAPGLNAVIYAVVMSAQFRGWEIYGSRQGYLGLLDPDELIRLTPKDVADITDVPLVATHSAAHKICPSTRNLTDEQIDAIGETDGIIGINFHVGFIRPDGKRDPDTPLSDLVDHVVYIADRIGVDNVALGSDFDGATMPDELGDVSGLPKLVTALRSSGFNEEELRKIAHENWLRVLRMTWKA